MSPALNLAVDLVLDLAFPQRCSCCGVKVRDRSLGVACAECWSETMLFDGDEAGCPKCGKPADGRSELSACVECSSHDYDLVRSAGIYEKAMSSNILRLKRIPTIPGILLDRMRLILERDEFGQCDLVLPVPLSAQRRADRGFNQAEIVARSVARMLDMPIDAASLVRRKHTPMHRAAMDRKAREMSVENAFAVRRPKLIDGRNILLVDDIFTSGSTVSNCAKVLKKKGAGKVMVFTLARAVGMQNQS